MIYFCGRSRVPDSDLVMRIGHSDAVDRRLESHLQSGHELVACMPGTRDHERRLHAHFQALGLRWSGAGSSTSFYDGVEMWDYVDRLLSNSYASANLLDLEHIPDLPWDVIDPAQIKRPRSEDGQFTIFDLGPKQRVRRVAKTAIYQSGSDEWYTPAYLIESARALLGTIDLDPASCPEANKIVRATSYYSARVDGLSIDHPWRGRVWMNPPFGGQAQKFLSRLIAELSSGSVTEAIALFSAGAMVCKWFQPVYSHATMVMVSRGRPVFTPGEPALVKGDGESPGNGVVIAYFGSRADAFVGSFSPHGQCLVPVKSPA